MQHGSLLGQRVLCPDPELAPGLGEICIYGKGLLQLRGGPTEPTSLRSINLQAIP